MMLHAPAMFMRIRLVTVHLSQVGALATSLLTLLRKPQAPQEITTAPSPSPLGWTSPLTPRWPS
jgi:hypothetical protein